MVRKTDRVYYGWVIVAVSFLTLFFTLGTRYSSGLFYVAILEECDWGRAATAGAFSLAMLIHGLFAIVTGTLIDRFGPRVLFPIGATFLAVGLAAASRINAIWHLYLFFGVVMAMGINTLSFAPHMSRIPKWFIRRGGLASGLVVSGTGLGIMVMSPIIQFMIDTIGWRSAFLTLAVIAITVVVPMTALFQRRSPEDVGQFPDGIAPDSRGIQTLPPKESLGDTRSPHLSRQWTLRTALCTRTFWWLALMNSSAGFVTHMLVVHQAAHMVDVGYKTTLAALAVGLVGLLSSPGGILCGFLSDRAGREIAYTLGSSATFVGILLFLFARDTTSPWLIYGFVILYGLGSGSLGPTYAATTADFFPGNSIGRIFGTLSIGFGFGGALGPYVGGYFYDHRGSYTLPFLLGMLSIGIGVLGIWVAAPRHRRTLGK